MCFQNIFKKRNLESPNTNQDHIFNITILKRDLGTERKCLKMNLLSLNQDKLSFMKEKKKKSSKTKSIDLMYSCIRACGIRDTFFYMVFDDNDTFDCGFLWIKTTQILEIYDLVSAKIKDCSCKRKLIPTTYKDSGYNSIASNKVLPPPRPPTIQVIHRCTRKLKPTTNYNDSGYMVPPPPRPFQPQNKTEFPCYIS